MADSYQDTGYEQPEYYAPQPKQRMSGWLIALIVIIVLIVLCCLCVCAALVLGGPAIGNTFSTIIQDLATLTPMP
jgi:hypothetical protein